MELPIRILVKFRINPGWMAKFRAAGIREVSRTTEQDAALRDKQAAEARAICRDPYRGHRVDATGTVRPDSGTPIFSWDPKGRVNVCLVLVITDLKRNLGMVLTQTNLLQKPEDHMGFLVLKFEPAGTTEVVLTDKQAALVAQIASRVYGNVHGFRNPDRSWTFNAAHAEDNPSEIRDVRIDADGHVRCEPR